MAIDLCCNFRRRFFVSLAFTNYEEKLPKGQLTYVQGTKGARGLLNTIYLGKSI
jgi:hypothetical protein